MFACVMCSAGPSSSLLLDPEGTTLLSPNPAFSENLQKGKGAKKPGSAFLVAATVPPLKLSAAHLKPAAFDLSWAQTQTVKDTPSRLTYRVYKLSALVRLFLRPDFWTGGLTWELLCSNKPILLLFQFGLFRLRHWGKNLLSSYRKPIYLGAKNPGGVEPSRWVNRVPQPHGGHSSPFIFLSTRCDRLSTWGKLPISEPPPTEVPDTSSGSRPLLGQRPPGSSAKPWPLQGKPNPFISGAKTVFAPRDFFVWRHPSLRLPPPTGLHPRLLWKLPCSP